MCAMFLLVKFLLPCSLTVIRSNVSTFFVTKNMKSLIVVYCSLTLYTVKVKIDSINDESSDIFNESYFAV